jgi:hypothetical protein
LALPEEGFHFLLVDREIEQVIVLSFFYGHQLYEWKDCCKPPALFIGNNTIICSMENGYLFVKLSNISVHGESIPDHNSHRINWEIVPGQVCHAVIRGFQDQLPAGPVGSYVCGNAGANGFSINDDAVGMNLFCCQAVNYQGLFILN